MRVRELVTQIFYMGGKVKNLMKCAKVSRMMKKLMVRMMMMRHC